MIKIESSSSNKKSKRIGTTTITFVLVFSVAAFVASGVAYGAKPAPKLLNATLCNSPSFGGTWNATTDTCTIPAGNSGVANQDVTISRGVTLDVKGSLTINTGVTIANVMGGAIIVENSGGVFPGTPHDWETDWDTGILVYGTLDNFGTITINNVYDQINLRGTDGITVSVSVSATDWNDPNTYVVVPGSLTNSGTITIQNRASTRGIESLGTITNSIFGTITVANSGTSSVGIYIKRYGGSGYYISGTMTNARSITISSSGDSNSGTQFGYGIYSGGLFTNYPTGTFTIKPSSASDDARGFYNSGSFTNYGKFTNNRGHYNEGDDPNTANWGSYNNFGTMINYGTTTSGTANARTGTFFNNLIMLNYSTIISYGTLDDETQGLMTNYDTIYNYGLILGGTNRAICIDEPPASPIGTGCN